jgi:hypothetical protein
MSSRHQLVSYTLYRILNHVLYSPMPHLPTYVFSPHAAHLPLHPVIAITANSISVNFVMSKITDFELLKRSVGQ